MPHPAWTFVLALAIGILAQSAARHLRLPGIVLLLLAGGVLGPDALGWVEPRALGDGLFAIVDLAVALILFEGGLNLQISRLRREQAAIRRLVSLGALVTLAGGALAARWILEWGWEQSLLFGGLVVVTGPTVIGPLVAELRLRPRIATVLEAEGVLIDPIGAILAVLLLEVVLAPTADSLADGARVLLLRVGFGSVAGVLAGYLLARLLRVRNLVPEGLENVFVLASVLLLFEGCDEILSHSGILAVTVAGVVVGNVRTRVDRDLREFKDQLTVLMIGMLFVLLAADVRIADVRALGLGGLAVLAALVLIVRPLTVLASTQSSGLGWREKAFLAWVAPRGIVAAAVASLAASALEAQGVGGGVELRALVFLTIGGTVVLAGLSAGPVGTLLGLRLPGRETVAILGAQELGFALADELVAAGRPVVFLDANPAHCRNAEERGFSVVYGDALQERTMLRARFDGVGIAIGLTPNQVLNSVFASRARQRFGVPRAYVAAEKVESGLATELVEARDVEFLFDGAHDVERWDVRFRHDGVALEQWRFRGSPPQETPKVGERYVVLTIRRGKDFGPMFASRKLQEGDVASVAVHRMELEEAHELLRQLGWEPVEEKTEATS